LGTQVSDDRTAGAAARTIRVLPEADAAARAAAASIGRIADESIAERGRFLIALSGGASPLPLFDVLVRDYAVRIDWPAVHVFWADERCVPPDDPASNYAAAHARLLARLPVPPTGIHRIRGELSPPVAAGAYRAELAAFFGAESPARTTAFDLVLLGMGEDGHTASIFPGSPALHSSEWALDVEAPPDTAQARRVTITSATIAVSRYALLLVTGARKAAAVARAYEPAARLPAGQVAARNGVTWVLDADAAAGLDRA
jgi:6-phosphogluconolactonase